MTMQCCHCHQLLCSKKPTIVGLPRHRSCCTTGDSRPTCTHHDPWLVTCGLWVGWVRVRVPSKVPAGYLCGSLTVCAYLFGQSSHTKLISQAYDGVKTQKSKIASSVLEVVRKFFDKAAFRDKPEKICEYVHWTLRPDGPTYYERPTPQECRADWAHSDYVVSFVLICNGTVFDVISAT
jgi:hypothetical protein